MRAPTTVLLFAEQQRESTVEWIRLLELAQILRSEAKKEGYFFEQNLELFHRHTISELEYRTSLAKRDATAFGAVEAELKAKDKEYAMKIDSLVLQATQGEPNIEPEIASTSVLRWRSAFRLAEVRRDRALSQQSFHRYRYAQLKKLYEQGKTNKSDLVQEMAERDIADAQVSLAEFEIERKKQILQDAVEKEKALVKIIARETMKEPSPGK